MASLLGCVILSLFWSLVHSQTFPYVSFMGQTLANHSYVDLSTVGSEPDGSDSVQCHTDLSTCCSGIWGPHRGDWYSLMELDCHSLVIQMRVVELRELTYIKLVLLDQLVFIAVIFQLELFMMLPTPQ